MPITDHLTADEIAAFVAGRLSGDQRSGAEDHLSTCRACRRALVARHAAVSDRAADEAPESVPDAWLERARRLVPSEPGPPADAGTPPAGVSVGSHRYWRRGFAAAAVLTIAALGWTFVGRDHTPAPDRSVVRDSGAVVSIAPDLVAPVADARFRPTADFRWTATPGANAYVLTVLDERGEVVASAETATETSLSLPDVGWVAGTRYYWFVDARLADGDEARSDVERFVVALDP